MNNLVKTFNESQVRIIMIEGTPYFVASDVCSILGITNITEALRTIDNVNIRITEVQNSMGSLRKTYTVNEPGLYALIFKSRKEEAKRFQSWVFSEVLPSIRKTGEYSISGSLRSKSTKTRNMMTEEWQKNGINDPKEFAYLTLEEYRLLQFEKDKRKKDFSEGELKTLMALEAMEMLNLHYNPVSGYIECKTSLAKTSKKILEITKGEPN